MARLRPILAIRLTTTEPPGSTHCRPSFRSTPTTAHAHSCLWQTTSHQRVEVAASVARIWSAAWRIDCSQLEPGAVIRPDPGECHPLPERLE